MAHDFIIENGVLKAYTGRENIVSVPSGVTAVGSKAFAGCKRLQQVILPDGVTSIGDSAFFGCPELTEIHIPDSVVSIGIVAFCHCANLKRISLPDSVTSIGEMAFSGCGSLAEMHIPGGVTSIEPLTFAHCVRLERMEIPDGVTSIGRRAFMHCALLKSVRIPLSVVSIGEEAFFGCGSLEEAAIPDHVTDIGRMTFLSCDSLKKLRIFGYTIDGTGWNWEKDSPAAVLQMLRDGDYEAGLDVFTTYTFALPDYRKDRHPGAEKFIRGHACRILKGLVKKDDYEGLRILLDSGIVLPRQAVADALDFAVKYTQKGGNMQFQVMLADYKNRMYPDSDPLGGLKI